MKRFISMLLGICSLQAFSQANFKLSAGTTIHTADAAQIVLENIDLINDGNIIQNQGDGRFVFTGEQDNSLAGHGITSFDKLILAKSSSSIVFLNTNIQVSGVFQFSSGKMNLTNYIVDLETTGFLEGESESNRFFSTGNGYIQAVSEGQGKVPFNPGNLGALITTSASMGRTIVRRGHVPQSIQDNGLQSITRYYDILPSNNKHLNATVQLRYFQSETNTTREAEFTIMKSTAAGAWKDLGVDVKNRSENYLQKTGVNDFSKLTISTSSESRNDVFSVWPNPVIHTLILVVTATASTNLKIQVYDNKGALIQVQNAALEPGKNEVALDMQNLSRGTYTIAASWNGITRTSKIIKR